MKSNLRKALALLLTLMMVLTSLPTSALAEMVTDLTQSVTDVSEGKQLFGADFVSPQSIVDEETYNYITYIFTDENGKTLSTQIVKNGDTLYAPASPEKEGYKFTGWYDGEALFTSFGKQENIGETKTVTLKAEFAQVYYVFFHDQNGRVVATKEGATGDSIETSEVTFTVGTEEAIEGWYTNEQHTGGAVASVTIENSNIHLYANVVTGFWVKYDSDGGSYVAPEFYRPGETADLTQNKPTKAGYNFLGWFSGDAEVKTATESVEVTAHWEMVSQANYTVVLWKQKVTDDKNATDDKKTYEYSETLQRTGKPGTTVSYANVNVSYNGFTKNTTKSESKEIAPDGSTIINVYYDRVLCTVNYYVYERQNGGWWPDGGNSGSWEIKKTVTGLYGADLKDGEWWTDYYWYTSYSGGSVNGSGCILLTAYDFETAGYADNKGNESANGAGVVTTCNFYGTTKDTGRTIYYYNEQADGSYKLVNTVTSGTGTLTIHEKYAGYDLYKYATDSQDGDKTLASWWAGKDTVKDGTKVRNTNTVYIANKLKTFKVEYSNDGAIVHTEDVKYTASLSGYDEKWTKDDLAYPKSLTDSGKLGYTFDGWYADPEGTEKFDFNTTMPAGNIVVYAKWVEPDVGATAYVSVDAQDGTTIEVKYGETIDQNKLPNINLTEGQVLAGWYTKDENGVLHPWNFDQKVYEHIKLYARVISTKSFSVSYDLNEGSGTAPSDEKKYAQDSYADVKAFSGEAPEGMVFLYWTTNKDGSGKPYYPSDKLLIGAEDVTLYAQYGDQAGTTSITYFANNGTNDKVEETGLPNNDLHTVIEQPESFVRNGYEFAGWAKNADAKDADYQPNDKVRLDEDETPNVLYAVWKEAAEVKITYKVYNDIRGKVRLNQDDAQAAAKVSENVRPVTGNPVGATAVPATGWRFVEWKLENNRVSTTERYQPTKEADELWTERTYVAYFEQIREDLTVKKDWVDVAEYASNRVGVKLTIGRKTANETDYVTYMTVELPQGNSWQTTIPAETHDENGNVYTYKVTKEEAASASAEDQAKLALYEQNLGAGTTLSSGATLTVTNTLRVGSLTVTKNVTNLPETEKDDDSFTFQIKKGNDIVQVDGQDTFTLKAGGIKTIANLIAGTYTVTETSTDTKHSYTTSYVVGTGTSQNGATATADVQPGAETQVTFTNTGADANSVTAVKVWQDDNDAEMRPESIKIQLYKQVGSGDATPVGDAVTLSEDGEWKHTWAGKPKYENSQTITYSVKEIDADGNPIDEGSTTDGYKVSYNGMTITNTLTGSYDSATFTKNWQNYPSYLPEATASFGLYRKANGTRPTSADDLTGWELVGETFKITSGAQDPTKTWNDLPKYDGQGRKYTYIVVETEITGFTDFVETWQAVALTETENNLTGSMTNTILTDTSLTVTKNVGDNSVVKEGGTFTFQITRKNGETDVPVDGTFGDVTVANGTFTIAVSADKSSESVTLTGLPYGEYTVTESAASGWTTTGSPASVTLSAASNTAAVTVTNTRDTKTLTVKKVWVTLDDADKPEVTIQIKRAVGNSAAADYTTITLNGSETTPWQQTITVPESDASGQPYVYTAEEQSVPAGYEVEYSYSTDGATIVVTNKLSDVQGALTVEKNWVDGKTQRPDSVRVQLYADGKAQGEAVTLNEANGWTYTYENLQKYADDATGNGRHKVVYTVVEENVDLFTTTYSPASVTLDGEGNTATITVTNTFNAGTTQSVTVTKQWDDQSNKFGLRPEKVTMKLYATTGTGENVTYYTNANGKAEAANGKTEIASVKFGGTGNTWTQTVSDMPKYAPDGTELTYSVEEDAVANYTTSYAGLTVTNTLNTDKTLTVSKTVVNNGAQIAGEDVANVAFTFTVQYKDAPLTGVQVKIGDTETTLGEDGKFTLKDGQTATISGLPSETYTVTETESSVWTTKVNDVAGNETNVVLSDDAKNGSAAFVNTRVLQDEGDQFAFDKVWVDGSNKYETRPEQTEFVSDWIELKAGDKAVSNATSSVAGEADTWTVSYGNLPKFDLQGIRYQYAVSEKSAEATAANYDSSTSESEEGYTTITNTLLVDITVTKEYHLNGIEMDEPEVTLKLMNGNVQVGEEVTTTNRTYKWSDLPYSEGYKVVETNVNDGEDISLTYLDEDGNAQTSIEPSALFEMAEANVTLNKDAESGKVSGSATLTNTAKFAAIKIQKTIAGVLSDVAGAKFEFGINWVDASGKVIETPKGKVEISGLSNTTTTKTTEQILVPTVEGGQKLQVVETPVNGWTATPATATVEAGGTASFTNTRETKSITVKKVWDGQVNGATPEGLTITLKRGSDVIGSVVLQASETSSENWQHTFTNLPTHDQNGNAYSYTVEETQVLGYHADVTSQTFEQLGETNEVTFTNTPQLGSFEIEKVDPDGRKLEGVEFTLKQDDGFILTGKTDANGRLSFADLPIGVYKLTETETITGYARNTTVWTVRVEGQTGNASTASVSIDGMADGVLTVRNEFDTVGTALNLTKNIADNSWNAYTGAFNFSVTLKNNTHKTYTVAANGVNYPATNGEVTISGISLANGASVLITGMPYGTTAEISETRSDAWTAEWKQGQTALTETNGAVEVTLADGTVTYVTVTNTRNTTADIGFVKVWNDESNAYGLRPQSVTVNLEYKDDDEWKQTGLSAVLSGAGKTGDQWTFENISFVDANGQTKTVPTTDAQGNAYVYRLSETAVEGYTASEPSVAGNTTTITNTLDKAGKLTIVKNVEDSTVDAADATFTFQVKRVGGTKTDTVTVNTAIDAETKAQSGQTQIALPAGEYVVSEDAISGWTLKSVEGATEKNGVYKVDVTKEGATVTFTNERNLFDADGKFEATKIWKDAWTDDEKEAVQDFFKLRPTAENFQKKLTLQRKTGNGKWTDYRDATVTVAKTADDTYAISVSDLPAYSVTGEKYDYRVVEGTVDHYTTEQNSAENNGTITNSLERGALTIEKTIVDNTTNPQGEVTFEFTVTAKNGVSFTRTIEFDLSKSDEGTKSVQITGLPYGEYTVVETNNNAWTTTVGKEEIRSATADVGADEATVSFTNTRKLYGEKGEISGTKTWEMIDGEAYPTITIKLLRNGEVYKTVELANGTKEFAFTNLPRYDQTGKTEYTYRVEEVVPDGYELTQTDTNLTNTAKTLSVTVTKTWLDGDGAALKPELQPATLDVQLKRNGDVYRTATLKKASWTTVFTGLPTHDEKGDEYVYTVTETESKGFTAASAVVDVKPVALDGELVPDAYTAELVNTKETENKQDPKKTVDDSSFTNVIIDGTTNKMVKVGDEMVYTIRYYNHLNTKATIVVTDKLNENLKFENASNGGTCDDQNLVTWEIKDVAPFTEDFVTVTVRVKDSVLSDAVKDPEIPNTASVKIGDNPAQDVKADDVTVYNANFSVTKTVEKPVYTLGETARFTITVQNTGNVPLENVAVKDEMVGIADKSVSDVKILPGDGYTVDENGDVTIAALGVDGKVEISAEYTVISGDLGGKKLENHVVATAKDPYDPEKEIERKAEATFTTDAAKSLTILKDWVGTDEETQPDEIGVQLMVRKKGEDSWRSYDLGEGERYATPETMTGSGANWQEELFTNLPAHDENGVEYEYTAVEASIDGRAVVNGEFNGYDIAVEEGADEVRFTNTRQMKTIRVQKNWIDGEGNALDLSLVPNIELAVQLRNTADGTVVDEVKLSKANNWTAEFEAQPVYDKAGNAIAYAVAEVGEDGKVITLDGKTYDVSYAQPEATREGTAATITNARRSDDPEDNKPTKEAQLPENKNAVEVGDTIEYTIKYHNSRNVAATVTITDVLDKGVKFLFASEGGVYDEATHTVTWKFDKVAPFTTGKVTLKVEVTEAARELENDETQATVKNSASVAIGNEAAVDTNVVDLPVKPEEPEKPEKKATNLDQTGTKKVGDEIVYTIEYHNHLNTVENITVVDKLDEGVDFVSADNGGAYDAETHTVTWKFDKVAPFKGGTVTLTVAVNENARRITDGETTATVDNAATVEVGNDYTSTSETVKVPVTPDDPTDPTKKADDKAFNAFGMVAVGDELPFTVSYTNHLNTVATVTVRDTLEEGLTFVSADNGGTYDEATRTVTWVIENVAPFTSGSVTVVTVVNENAIDAANPTVANSAVVKIGDQPEQTTEPAEVTVYNPDFSVEKKLTNLPAKGYFTAGETAAFDITVKNTGNVALENVTVSEQLNGAAILEGEGYSTDGQTATIAALEIGGQVVVKAEYTVAEADLGNTELANVITGKGTVPGNPEDPEKPHDPEDKGDEEPIPTDEFVDLTGTKNWNDGENVYNTRPEAITLRLLANGAEKLSTTANAETGWTYAFNHQPKHDADGNEIVYTVTEDAVDGYTVTYAADSFDVTNTLQRYTLTVRYWIDEVGGEQAFGTFTRDYYYGESYNVVSPTMAGYRADQEVVNGVIHGDLEVDVVYTAILFRLNIRYRRVGDGATLAPMYTNGTMRIGDPYDVTSPTIPGYTADMTVMKGEMHGRNMSFTVWYVPEQTEIVIIDEETPFGLGNVVMNAGDCFE